MRIDARCLREHKAFRRWLSKAAGPEPGKHGVTAAVTWRRGGDGLPGYSDLFVWKDLGEEGDCAEDMPADVWKALCEPAGESYAGMLRLTFTPMMSWFRRWLGGRSGDVVGEKPGVVGIPVEQGFDNAGGMVLNRCLVEIGDSVSVHGPLADDDAVEAEMLGRLPAERGVRFLVVELLFGSRLNVVDGNRFLMEQEALRTEGKGVEAVFRRDMPAAPWESRLEYGTVEGVRALARAYHEVMETMDAVMEEESGEVACPWRTCIEGRVAVRVRDRLAGLAEEVLRVPRGVLAAEVAREGARREETRWRRERQKTKL